MLRIWPEQTEQLERALSVDPIDLAESYLRRHYPDDCAEYDRDALRAWIQEALVIVCRRDERSSSEVLFDLGTRFVLRDWLGAPAARAPGHSMDK